MFTLPRVGAEEGARGTRECEETEDSILRRLVRLELELVRLMLLFRLGVRPVEGGFIGGKGVVEGVVEVIVVEEISWRVCGVSLKIQLVTLSCLRKGFVTPTRRNCIRLKTL